MQIIIFSIFLYFLAWEQVYIHVYKLKDSDLGFYHTGIELYGSEFTYCQVGINIDSDLKVSILSHEILPGSRNCEAQTP